MVKPTIFGKFWHLGVFCTDLILPTRTKFGVLYSTPTVYAYAPNFFSIRLFCRPLAAKSQNFCVFWTSAFCDVASWQKYEKVEHSTDAQLQAFSYPTVSKCLLYSNAFLAKSYAQSLTFKGVTDRERDKNSTFWVKCDLHQTWQGDRGPWARSCTSKTFEGPTHTFAARDGENLGVIRPHQLKTPITP